MIGPRALLGTVAFLLWAGVARADDPTRAEDVLAQSLFDDATALMNAERYDEACPKYAESQRLAPAGGTLLNLAFCLEKLHKYASAYTAYNEALSASIKDGRKDREEKARERIAAVIPKLSRVALRVPPESRLPELDVRFDGTTVREAAWGVAAPVDPGPHEVIATAKGKKPWKLVLQVDAEGRTVDVTVGPFVDLPPEPVPVKPVVEPVPQKETIDTNRRTAAYVAGGVGAAFLLEGIITGVLALSAHGEHNTLCMTAGRCEQPALDAETRANALAWAANIGFGLAIAGGVTAGILFFTSKKAPSKSAFVFTGTGIQGRF